MVEEVDEVRLGPADGTVHAVFSGMERPHGDALAFFEVRLVGPGLDARIGVESTSGDHGLRGELHDGGGDVPVDGWIRLADWLRELAAADRPWDGEERWRCPAGVLRFAARCDLLGHVALRVSVQPLAADPPWRAEVTLRYGLGELSFLADQLDTWIGE